LNEFPHFPCRRSQPVGPSLTLALKFFSPWPPEERLNKMKGKRSKRSKRSKRLFKQNQADWQNDNTSDFQPLSPPDSPTLSSGYESVITEDLDLYDARCVF
jgi:hypothetical protein